MTDPAYYRALFRKRFAGRKVILATGMVASTGPTLALLREAQAETPFMLAHGVGTGAVPDASELEWAVVGGARADSVMGAMRDYEGGLARPPDEAARALDAYDPAQTALVIRAFTVNLKTIAGRAVYGAKRAAWIALEDKTTIDAFWDAVGVPRAPSKVVPLEPAALRAATAELDRGHGTVWAADATQGWHGGSEGIRCVTGEEALAATAAELEACHDRVRVMPFLEGIPCSVHGIVLPDHVVSLRPVEQVTLRRAGSNRFHYGGCATLWDPPPRDRETMRELARTVGAALRDRVGFRGAFTLDGVLTEDGFLPTELNPRCGAGIGTLARALPELPLYMLDQAICHGEAWDFRPRALEAMLLDSGDRVRVATARGWSALVSTEMVKHPLVLDADGEYQHAGPDDEPTAALAIGPSPLGSFVSFEMLGDDLPVGESMAPHAIRAFRFADREFGTGFGDMEPARPV